MAVELLLLSADSDYNAAKVELRLCFKFCVGVDKKHAEAVSLFKQAADAESKDVLSGWSGNRAKCGASCRVVSESSG